MSDETSAKWALMREVPDSLNACQHEFTTPCEIDLKKARLQHQAYRATLQSLGLIVDVLPADERFPDCCFVEDTAVLIDQTAVICRTGALTRRGEVDVVKRDFLERGYRVVEMSAPAQLDGGDVLQIGTDVFVGISRRTNRAGFEVIEQVAREHGCAAFPIEVGNALHLKTVCSHVGRGVVIGLVNLLSEGRSSLDRFQMMRPAEGEEEAANVSSVNGKVLVPAHCHRTMEMLAKEGFRAIPMDVSEFHKAEAGLTCLTILGNREWSNH